MKRRMNHPFTAVISCIAAAALACSSLSFCMAMAGETQIRAAGAKTEGSLVQAQTEGSLAQARLEGSLAQAQTEEEPAWAETEEGYAGTKTLQELAGPEAADVLSETETEEEAAQTETEEVRERIRISDADDLAELARRCSVDTNSKHLEVVLTDDISLSEKEYTPVPYFAGVFDGQGHTIRGLVIRSDGSCMGLFRHVAEGAVVRRLNVEGRIEPDGSAQSLGGIAGSNAGIIQECSFKGSVRAVEDGGGIAGVNEKSGTILGCSMQGKVISQHAAGGIAGRNEGTITNCVSSGKVNTEYIETDAQTKSSIAAGLANLSSFDVSSVSAQDFVDIMDIGGIAGYSEGLISECLSIAQVGYAHTGYNVGGIVGRSSGFTISCTNQGEVCGRKDVGGIVGQLEPESLWEYSQSRLENLKDQLIGLNALIDTLAQDVADSSGAIRDDIRNASARAEQTIGDLKVITEEVGFNIEKTSTAISEMMDQLKAALDEENAQALRTALGELAQLLSTTDFFNLPVYVTVKGDTARDFNSVLDAREGDWWKKLDEYLNSRDRSSGRTSNGGVQIPDGAPSGDAAAAGVSFPDGGGSQDGGTDEVFFPDGGADEGAAPDGGVVADVSGDDIIPDEDYSTGVFGDGQDTVPAYDEAAYDAGAYDEAAYDAGVYDEAVYDAGVQDDYAYAEPDAAVFMEPDAGALTGQEAPPEIYDDAAMSAQGEDEIFLPDNVVAEESFMTGSGMGEDEGIIVAEEGSGQTVLDYSSELSHSVPVGEAGQAGTTRDTNVKVDVNANLPDTTQLRSLIGTVLTDAAGLLDPVSLENAAQILKELQITRPDTEAFYEDFQSLASSIAPIADDVSNMTGKVASDIDAITDQLDLIVSTFFDLTQDISLDERYTQTDISKQNPYQSDDSSVESCRNEGGVNGDSNTGGVIGCIGFENKIDAEGVLDVSQYLLKDARYTVYASGRKCANKGTVTSKKESAGGICGSMEFGIVTDSLNTGAVTVEEGDYCGGICGRSQGTITNSCAGSLLSGGAYVGGIAGEGQSISSCISYSYIGAGREYLGAVAGAAVAEVKGCRYVDYGIGGVDNVGYAGMAEPVRLKWNEMAGMENAGSSCEITFVVEGQEYKKVKVPFGGSLETLPEVPNKGDDFWVWDDFEQEHIFSSQTITGAYHRATTTLATPGDVPQYLAEGVFYEGQRLTVTEFVPEESPVSTESIADILEDGVDEEGNRAQKDAGSTEAKAGSTEADAGRNAAEAEVDLEDTEAEGGRLAQAGRRLRRVITDRLTGPMIDAKTVSVNDYDDDLTVRAKLPGGGRLFTSGPDDTLTETDYETDGSYIVFLLENGGSFAYYESIRQNKDMRGRIALICGIAAAVLVVVLLLIHRHRKRRKKKAQEKKEQEQREQKEQEEKAE